MRRKHRDDDEDVTTGVAVPLPADLLPKVGGKAGFLIVMNAGSANVTGRIFKIEQSETIIGRTNNAQIQLVDEGVSRKHAKLITFGEGKYRIVDLDSKNGTHVNGQRVNDAELHDGDRIQVGSTAVLLFSMQDELEERFTQRLYESATHDSLTKLFNRRFFESALEKELSFCLRYRSPLSLLMIDIDRFKDVNDTHGHPAGDHVLTAVSHRMIKLIRNEDVLARYGGEEFAVILRQADQRSALICAERCRVGVAALEVKFNGTTIPVSVSVGSTTVAAGTGLTVEGLTAHADALLYEAKKQGRNRVVAGSFSGTGP
jgi:diguanylate cyclase (GGDEF)-like protein